MHGTKDVCVVKGQLFNDYNNDEIQNSCDFFWLVIKKQSICRFTHLFCQFMSSEPEISTLTN